VAVVVLLLLGVVGVVLINGRNNPSGGGPTAQASPSARATTSPPKASPSASTSPAGTAPRAVPTTFGPASADPIKSVQFCTTATPCPIAQGTPNETGTACDLNSCTVEVAFYFTTSQKSVQTSYILKFFDRCSGQTTDLPGPTSSTSASGYIVAIPADKWPVRIPSGVKSGALVAVAQKPAVAASPPLLLGSDTTC
jgi:hypothetical protein